MASEPWPGELVAIDEHECVELMRGAPWVRIAFVTSDGPTVLPINVILHEEAIYFRTATGSKLANAAATGAVAIEADGGDPIARVAWSVVAHGHAAILTDPAVEEALLALPDQPWALPDTRHFWVRVAVTSVTGRRIVRG